MDKALKNAFHVNVATIARSPIVCVLSGAFSSSGGGILYDWFGFNKPSGSSFVPAHTPSLLLANRFDAVATINRGMILSTLYYIVLHLSDYSLGKSWTANEARLLISFLQVYNTIITSFYPHVDIYQVITEVILSLLNIKPTFKY